MLKKTNKFEDWFNISSGFYKGRTHDIILSLQYLSRKKSFFTKGGPFRGLLGDKSGQVDPPPAKKIDEHIRSI